MRNYTKEVLDMQLIPLYRVGDLQNYDQHDYFENNDLEDENINGCFASMGGVPYNPYNTGRTPIYDGEFWIVGLNPNAKVYAKVSDEVMWKEITALEFYSKVIREHYNKLMGIEIAETSETYHPLPISCIDAECIINASDITYCDIITLSEIITRDVQPHELILTEEILDNLEHDEEPWRW